MSKPAHPAARRPSEITPEDRADIAVARKRLREIAKHPERLLAGAELKRKLKEWEIA
jgi:hypothetical protein